MRIRNRIFLLILGIMAISVAASSASWEGNAVAGTYGEFPSSGYFAASNSFARNTAVMVTNLDNNRSITVIISSGLDRPGLFMLLSHEAAQALGMSPGRVSRIKATEPKSILDLSPSGGRQSEDPDFNPRLLAEEELRKLGYALSMDTEKAEEKKPVETVVIEEAPETVYIPEISIPETVKPELDIIPTIPDVSTDTIVQDTAKPEEREAVAEIRPQRAEAIVGLGLKPESREVRTDLPAPPAVLGEKAEAIIRSHPGMSETELVKALYDPELPASERVEVIGRIHPVKTKIDALTYLYEAETDKAQRAEYIARMAPQLTSKELIHVLQDPETGEAERAAAYAFTYPWRYFSSIEPELRDPLVSTAEEAEAIAFAHPAVYRSDPSTGLLDPLELAVERAAALALRHPEMVRTSLDILLSEPYLLAEERPNAFVRFNAIPSARPAAVELAWPEIEADEMPSVYLTELDSPEEKEFRHELLDGQVYFGEDTIITMLPTEERPPVSDIITVIEKEIDREQELVIVPYTGSMLEKDRYYIQVGAYSSETMASSISTSLGSEFTVTVIEKVSGRELWRIYVGPLSRDESGVALARVRALGYRDAFVKIGS